MTNQFVVLLHEMPSDSDRASHFDWMFELDGSLRTWAVETNNDIESFLSKPSPSERFCWSAMKLANHRIDYLEYEGPVSNNRGQVSCCLKGEFDLLCDDEDSFRASLRIRQPSDVSPIEIRFGRDENNWRLIVGQPAIDGTSN